MHVCILGAKKLRQKLRYLLAHQLCHGHGVSSVHVSVCVCVCMVCVVANLCPVCVHIKCACECMCTCIRCALVNQHTYEHMLSLEQDTHHTHTTKARTASVYASVLVVNSIEGR